MSICLSTQSPVRIAFSDCAALAAKESDNCFNMLISETTVVYLSNSLFSSSISGKSPSRPANTSAKFEFEGIFASSCLA